MTFQERPQHVFAGGCSIGVGFFEQSERILAVDLPCEFAPKGADGLLAVLPRLAGGKSSAVQHNDSRLREVHQFGLIEQRGNTGQVFQGAFSRSKVIDGEHGMRLAAAESGLKLNDRVAALAVETAGNGCEQQAHSLGDERSFEKRHRVLIFPRGLAGVNRGDVRGELGLLERAFEHVRVGNGNFSPRFHDISGGRLAGCNEPGVSRIGQTVFLQTALGFIGDGALQYPIFDQRSEIVGLECLPVTEAQMRHDLSG